MNRLWTGIGLFCFLSLGILLPGCETPLEWPANVLPKLTIISHLSPGSWEEQGVYIYASKSPLDSTQFYSPYNTEVEVTEIETDLKIRLDSVRTGQKVFFEFPSGFLKPGHTYTIKAEAPGFPSVHATTTIPEPSTVTDLRIENVRIEPSTKNEFKKIVRYTLKFNIHHFESNRYYHLVFYNAYAGSTDLFVIDPELSDNQPFIRHYAYGVLIDRNDLVEGQPLAFNFVDWIVDNQDLRRVYVELRSISEEYYKYHSTLARQLIVRQDPFAEPVTIFNNIDGGYGNFSGFTPNVSSTDLPE